MSEFPECLLIVTAEVDTAIEAEWSRWYDTVHLPDALRCPGVRSGRRYVSSGEISESVAGKTERTTRRIYTTIYELDSPDAIATPEFRAMRGWYQFAPHVRSRTQVIVPVNGRGDKNMTAHIERHNPDGVWKGRTALYNHCVRVTNATTTLYIAGQLARDENGQTVGVDDIRAQTAKVIENIRTILRAEGGDLHNLVKLTVYTTDMRYFDAIAEVRRRYFTSDLPTSTIVEVARLAQPDLLIEIESIAVL